MASFGLFLYCQTAAFCGLFRITESFTFQHLCSYTGSFSNDFYGTVDEFHPIESCFPLSMPVQLKKHAMSHFKSVSNRFTSSKSCLLRGLPNLAAAFVNTDFHFLLMIRLDESCLFFIKIVQTKSTNVSNTCM